MTTTVPPPEPPTVGSRLRELRRARGWSLTTASDHLGYSLAALGSWERGDRQLSMERLAELAGAYQVDVAELLGEQPRPAAAHVVLDLAVLGDAVGTSRVEALRRWTDAIRRGRGDWAGGVLSIRDGDLYAIAQVTGLPYADALPWLALKGLLADGSMRPVTS